MKARERGTRGLRKRAIEFRDRFGDAREVVKRYGALGAVLAIFRVELQRALEALQRLAIAMNRKAREPEAEPAMGGARIFRRSGFGDVLGFGMLAPVEENAHEVTRRNRRKAASGISRAEVLEAFVEPPLPGQQQGELLMRFGGAGIVLKRFA